VVVVVVVVAAAKGEGEDVAGGTGPKVLDIPQPPDCADVWLTDSHDEVELVPHAFDAFVSFLEVVSPPNDKLKESRPPALPLASVGDFPKPVTGASEESRPLRTGESPPSDSTFSVSSSDVFESSESLDSLRARGSFTNDIPLTFEEDLAPAADSKAGAFPNANPEPKVDPVPELFVDSDGAVVPGSRTAVKADSLSLSFS
jgi:hypothetical protein